jgi:parallel beta-helix repeat protein
MNAFICPKPNRRLSVGSNGPRPRRLAAWRWLLAAALLLVGAAGRGTPAEFAPAPEPKIVVVDADGKGDFTSVGKALQDAKDGTTVRIKPGHYKEDALAIGHNITMEADGPPGSVVIEMSADAASGIRSTAENAVFRKIAVRAPAGSALLIEKGGAEVEDCRFSAAFTHKDGSAVVSVTTSGKVHFVRTRVNGNPDGCGFQIAGKSEVTLEDCDVFNNASHNLSAGEQAHVTLKDCRILAALLDGVHANGSTKVVAENCEFIANGRNGFRNEEQSRAELHRCLAHRNLGNGISLGGSGGGVMDGCTITGNGGNGATIGK